MVLEDRPLVTLALFTYNQQDFIAQAVAAALAQTYSPLEIIISDDCSQDETLSIINSIISSYAGSHKVIVRRNESNLGLLAHINTVMEMVRGELIVVAAGDDISMPHRVEYLVNFWLEKKASVLFSNAMIIDQDGAPHGQFYSKPIPQVTFEDLLVGKSIIIGATCAWEKKVFDIFGPLLGGAINEDLMIPLRGAMINKVQYVNASLVYYRRHSANLYTRLGRSSISSRAYLELMIIHQRNILLNCLEFKNLLDIGKNKGLTNVDYQQAAGILDERIACLLFEIHFLAQNFKERLGNFFRVKPGFHTPAKFVKFVLILISPKFYANVLRSWINLRRKLQEW